MQHNVYLLNRSNTEMMSRLSVQHEGIHFQASGLLRLIWSATAMRGMSSHIMSSSGGDDVVHMIANYLQNRLDLLKQHCNKNIDAMVVEGVVEPFVMVPILNAPDSAIKKPAVPNKSNISMAKELNSAVMECCLGILGNFAVDDDCRSLLHHLFVPTQSVPGAVAAGNPLIKLIAEMFGLVITILEYVTAVVSMISDHVLSWSWWMRAYLQWRDYLDS